ncbi:amino acid permease [Pseudonocardia sp. RS010]|uniref:amino acid permease n=1 Tax=Pseudonocardia sp. RS010 TaxID=3385979 RepID=UPI0039A0F3D2
MMTALPPRVGLPAQVLPHAGASDERFWLPRPFGAVHPRRRTPWVSILFSSVVAYALVLASDISLLGGTTSLLLLAVFTVVNVAVLVLRRKPVDHRHFRAPTWAPVLGVLTCGYLATPLSGRPAQQFAVAGGLLGVGVLLCAVNALVMRSHRARGGAG